MHSFSDCRSGWSKEPQWKNNCGYFLPCFLLMDFTQTIGNFSWNLELQPVIFSNSTYSSVTKLAVRFSPKFIWYVMMVCFFFSFLFSIFSVASWARCIPGRQCVHWQRPHCTARPLLYNCQLPTPLSASCEAGDEVRFDPSITGPF